MGLLLSLLLQYLECPLEKSSLYHIFMLPTLVNVNLCLICRAEHPTSQSAKRKPRDNLTGKNTTFFVRNGNKSTTPSTSYHTLTTLRAAVCWQFSGSFSGVSHETADGEHQSKSVPAADTRRSEAPWCRRRHASIFINHRCSHCQHAPTHAHTHTRSLRFTGCDE